MVFEAMTNTAWLHLVESKCIQLQMHAWVFDLMANIAWPHFTVCKCTPTEHTAKDACDRVELIANTTWIYIVESKWSRASTISVFDTTKI